MPELNNESWFDITYLPENLSDITTKIKEDGFYCLEGVVRPTFLSELQESVNKLIKIYGKRYFSLIHPHERLKEEESLSLPYENIIKNNDFSDLLNRLSGEFSINKRSNSERFNILRVVTGEKTDDQSLKFHYDSTLVTALIPIYIPDGLEKESGHLVVLPNARKIRSSILVNILEKFFIQNKLSQMVLPYLFLRSQKKRVLKLEPGNIYLFSGLQSLHSNFAVNKDYVRATLLCFYGNPYPDSKILSWVKQTRHNQEDKNIGI
tara:strand:+ start:1407 stop:2198 length:792 start_codon:yes stop_codon:yes gene_type:complete